MLPRKHGKGGGQRFSFTFVSYKCISCLLLVYWGSLLRIPQRLSPSSLLFDAFLKEGRPVQ